MRDAAGFVLCCHGRPIHCLECGDEYEAELSGAAGAGGAATPHLAEYRALVEFGEPGSVEAFIERLVGWNDRLASQLGKLRAQSVASPAGAGEATPTVEANSQAPAGDAKWLDTPVKAARRAAFDNPTIANLDALIAAVENRARR